jgi:hypothetical protein
MTSSFVDVSIFHVFDIVKGDQDIPWIGIASFIYTERGKIS